MPSTPLHSMPSLHSTPSAHPTPSVNSTPSVHSPPPALSTPSVHSMPSVNSTPSVHPTLPGHSAPVILFDLDGTLIDSLELLVGAMQHAFDSRTGPRPSVEEWVATIGRPLIWQFGQYAADEDLQTLVQSYRSYQLEHHDRLTRPFDGIPQLVARLHSHGHALGVVTSKADFLANRSLSHVGLSEHFDIVVGADKTTRHKPEPEPIWFALQQLSARAEDAVYIGDSPFDIMSANAAGVRSIGVTWGAATRAQITLPGPTHIVTTPDELERLLSQLPPPHSP